MKSLSLYETKNRFSEICDAVASTGEPCVVTRRGAPLVRIVPLKVEEEEESLWVQIQKERELNGPIEEELELPERELSLNRPSPLGGDDDATA